MCSEYSQRGFYLGFIVWGRRPEWAKATSFLGGPRTFNNSICAEMQSGAFWDSILRNVTVCALTSSRLNVFFWYSYLIYTEMITDNVFWGEAGHFFWGGGGGEASTPQIPQIEPCQHWPRKEFHTGVLLLRRLCSLIFLCHQPLLNVPKNYTSHRLTHAFCKRCL